jgi:uncharacterized protein (DUF2249 family)/iron-sulfur cluster repair protein YtfE (RIC family)
VTITSAQEAFEVMRSHHRLLGEQLVARAAAVSEAVAGCRPHDAALADLVAYLAEEVLPHAIAEEETIYPAVAAARADLVAYVSEMAAEHDAFSAAAGALAGLTEGSAAAQRARQIAELFAAHAAKENEVLLPALLASDDVDLAALLAQMHRRAEEVARTGLTGKTAAPDPQRALVRLLLESARALARTRQADLACRVTAAAWAAVREDRPDLAVTVTAAMHGLAHRISTGQPQHAPAGAAEPARVSATAERGPELDVRAMPPAQRHETIFVTYAGLPPGGGFVLVNDHDPKPLWYQFEAEHAGQFTWESIEAGPEVWRVRIGRASSRRQRR